MIVFKASVLYSEIILFIPQEVGIVQMVNEGKKKMTNYEKIKSMSIEEMAKFFDNPRPFCTLEESDCINGWHGYSCEEHAKQWLNSEVE